MTKTEKFLPYSPDLKLTVFLPYEPMYVPAPEYYGKYGRPRSNCPTCEEGIPFREENDDKVQTS